jgi:hypothetical protein
MVVSPPVGRGARQRLRRARKPSPPQNMRHRQGHVIGLDISQPHAVAGALSPAGTKPIPPTKPQPDGVLVKGLAWAWCWQKNSWIGAYSLRDRDRAF